MTSKLLPLLATASALVLGACVVGPKAPDATLPPSASGAFVTSSVEGVAPSAPARNDWWRLYSDATLDRLVQQALAANNDIEAAAQNLRAVRATLRETGEGGRRPRLSASGSATSQQQSAAGFGPGGGFGGTEAYESYDVGLDVSYEIDLWGRITSAIRAARADAAAAEAALQVVRVSVAAETARAYADACALNGQLAVAERTIQLQSETARLTRTLFDNGAGTGLDVARARSAVASTEASLPPLRAQRDAALFRLATLTGVTPAEVDPAARACTVVPTLTQPIPVGDGTQLLARRPDVREAERRVAAAAARVNVAVAGLYPTISLGGSAGATALDLADLGESDNARFSIGPLISWSFTTPGVNRARIERADANTQGALAAFDQTVLSALQETETALSAYANELERSRALERARAEAAEAARLSRLRFSAGADSFLSVLDAERTLAGTEAQAAASRQAVASAQVTLFKALAGGWDQSAD